MTKKLYNIKGFDRKKNFWVYLGTGYFDPFDSDEQKDKEIKKLEQLYGEHYYFNISNFNNVYS
jgi:hypothetical protein